MTSRIINAQFNREKQKNTTYIANIHCPSTPTISGILAIITMDDNNNCKVMVENCAPYDVTVERNDLMGLIEIEEEELIPLTDRTISVHFIWHTRPITQSPETKDLTRRNCPSLPSPSPGWISWAIYQHSVLTPRGHQHRQVWPGAGQKLQTQNPSQKWWSSVPETL